MPRILDGHLSRGQLAALLLTANGFTSRQIAHELGTTESGIHQRERGDARLGGPVSDSCDCDLHRPRADHCRRHRHPVAR